MNAFEELRRLSSVVEADQGAKELRPIEPTREADMGGSGDAHEINWGDVTDLVKESCKQSFESTIHDSLKKMEMDEMTGEGHTLKDMPEYHECEEAIDDLAQRTVELMREAFDRNIIAKAGSKHR